MGKRVVIGYASSRSEGLMYEALLRSEGVPAFSELGMAFGEFSEASTCGIFADIESLTKEDLAVIRRVLGNKAAEPALRVIEPKLRPSREAGEAPEPQEVDSQEAERNRNILRRQGIVVDDGPGIDEPFVYEPPPAPPPAEVDEEREVPIAWYDDPVEAELNRDLLKRQGVRVSCFTVETENGRRYGLFALASDLPPKTVNIIGVYLGDEVKAALESVLRR